VYTSAEALEGDERPALVPDVSRKWTDYSQGTLAATGNPLDLAIAGKGFFRLDGGAAGTLLTRNGNFRISTKGDLETADGRKLKGPDGKVLKADPRKPLTISGDGTLSQDSQVIGKIELVEVADPQQLMKEGYGYFRLSNTAALKQGSRDSEIQQGRLESANFGPAEAAVRLISVMRQFEMLQRAASIGSEMSRRAVEEVARVGS
jgi:flagellar basal body rod protein FlgG